MLFRVPEKHPKAVPLYQCHAETASFEGGNNYWVSFAKTIQKPWVFDREMFLVFKEKVENTIPVFDYYLKEGKSTFQLFSTRQDLATEPPFSKWKFQGVAFWAYPK